MVKALSKQEAQQFLNKKKTFGKMLGTVLGMLFGWSIIIGATSWAIYFAVKGVQALIGLW